MAATTGDMGFDNELRKAFQELQIKVISTTQQVKMAEAQMATLGRSVQHSKLTDQELAALPTDVRAYEAFGRMFVLQPIPHLRDMIQTRISTAQEKIKGLETNKEYLQKSVKEQENSIREMLQQRK